MSDLIRSLAGAQISNGGPYRPDPNAVGPFISKGPYRPDPNATGPLIQNASGVGTDIPAPRQQTQFLRPMGSPVHYTDGTSEPAPAWENQGDGIPDMRQHLQPPEVAPPAQMQMPQYDSQQLNQVMGQQQARPQRAPSLVAQQNAAGQQNYQAMLNARQQAFQAEMSRRQQAMMSRGQ